MSDMTDHTAPDLVGEIEKELVAEFGTEERGLPGMKCTVISERPRGLAEWIVARFGQRTVSINWDEIDDKLDKMVETIPDIDLERTRYKQGARWMRHFIRDALVSAPRGSHSADAPQAVSTGENEWDEISKEEMWEEIQAIRKLTDNDGTMSPSQSVAHVVEAFEAMKDLADLNALQAGERWIPVSERLPGIGEDVLLWCGWAITGKFRGMSKGSKVFPPIPHFETEDGVNRVENVTHWQFLPEPPKEGK